MPESHLEIAGSAGFSSLPIKWGFLPKGIILKNAALAVNSHVRLKVESSIRASLDMRTYRTAPVVVDNVVAATRRCM